MGIGIMLQDEMVLRHLPKKKISFKSAPGNATIIVDGKKVKKPHKEK